jgi:LPS export ABC transporter protein LptC
VKSHIIISVIIKRIAQVVLLILLRTSVVGCRKKSVKLRAEAVTNRAEMAALEATDVMTIVSDSGVTRYRITTPLWRVYDRADTPYWEFPDGIYLEKFGLDLSSDATIEADYAHYNERQQLWKLRGNVKAVNLEGEQFETPLLFWDQKEETVYSDSSIVITREASIIKGIGFRSNQSMTQYTILRPTGVIPLRE